MKFFKNVLRIFGVLLYLRRFANASFGHLIRFASTLFAGRRAAQRKPRLVLVANRLPFSVVEDESGLTFKESTGGLVTGLRSYLSAPNGRISARPKPLWVGWPGATVSESRQQDVRGRETAGYRPVPVFLSAEEMDAFYLGFCNDTIWPLFHYFPTLASFHAGTWQHYKDVNKLFAAESSKVLEPNDRVWVHDYQLMLVPKLMREQRPGGLIGFFLHIPFPEYDVFRTLPSEWRKEILEGLLGADLIGFHTYDYAQHFLRCVQRILGYEHRVGTISLPDRTVRVEAFPMGIDATAFINFSNNAAVVSESQIITSSFPGQRIILSVDRLDYTKGIINRLQGFEVLLEQHPEFRGAVVLVIILVPSRKGVGHYDQLKKQIEELIGNINGKFGSVQWTPVVYQHKQFTVEQLVAYYRISDVALVTPLRDGMNLVAKEYLASRTDGTGVLILSEMAGAAKELGEAVIVNPNERTEIAAALYEALAMPPEEQRRRNSFMRRRIERYSVQRWVSEFLTHLEQAGTRDDSFRAKLLTKPKRETILNAHRASSVRCIFLDYDGTLVPFSRHPDDSVPTPEVLRTLHSLASDGRNNVTIVSGRDRRSLERWMGGLSIGLVAEHGAWWKGRAGGWLPLGQSSATETWKGSITPILESYADRVPGSFVEEKEFSLAWHYRSSDTDQSEQIVPELVSHLTNFTANIDVQLIRGNKVVEVRSSAANKGKAVDYLVRLEQPDFILAAGDDQTDEDMFRSIGSTGFSIKVGPGPTEAQFYLPEQRGLLDLLEALSNGES